MKFDAILGRTLLVMVVMKITKKSTEFIPISDMQVVIGLKKQVQDGEQE